MSLARLVVTAVRVEGRSKSAVEEVCLGDVAGRDQVGREALGAHCGRQPSGPGGQGGLCRAVRGGGVLGRDGTDVDDRAARWLRPTQGQKVRR
jgi:hypothetical protein